MGGAVSWGLLLGVSRGWRRVLKIADQGLVWEGRVFGIADQGLVAVLVRVGAGVLASQNGSFRKAALVQNRHFWGLGVGEAGL